MTLGKIERGLNKMANRGGHGGVELVADPPGIAPVHHQASLTQRHHVAGHARLTGVEPFHERANTVFAPIAQEVQRCEAVGLGQGGEQLYRISQTA